MRGIGKKLRMYCSIDDHLDNTELLRVALISHLCSLSFGCAAIQGQAAYSAYDWAYLMASDKCSKSNEGSEQRQRSRVSIDGFFFSQRIHWSTINVVLVSVQL